MATSFWGATTLVSLNWHPLSFFMQLPAIKAITNKHPINLCIGTVRFHGLKTISSHCKLHVSGSGTGRVLLLSQGLERLLKLVFHCPTATLIEKCHKCAYQQDSNG